MPQPSSPNTLVFLLLGTLLTGAPQTSAQEKLSPPASKPNFVIIFVDDQGYADLGCFGSTDIKTPRIDEMAAQGMKFTHFYAQYICGPSRTALMTGSYPLRVAERGNTKQENHPIVHSEEITIAEVLKPLGYTAGCFGKWDLARHNQKDFHPDLMPNHQGFDYFFGTPTSNDRLVNLYRNEELIEEETDMATLTKRYTDEAIGFIKKNKDQPFFVYVPHTMPHTRLDASADFKGRSPRGLYGDVIEEIDFSTGRILDAISNLNLANNTYVIYTSDNGPWLVKNKNYVDGHLPEDHGGSAGPLRSGKVSTWEGGVRVPTVAWAPGRIPADAECHEIARTLDLLPTFAALAGTGTPDDRTLDGHDISDLLHGTPNAKSPSNQFLYYFRNHLQAVRHGKWKLHFPRPQNPPWYGNLKNNKHIHPDDWTAIDSPLLYNLETDPGETSNLADKYPKVVARLERIAETARKEIGDYNRLGSGARFFDEGPKRPNLANFQSSN
ncbi:MAG: sulfatase [Verrucomicrobiota bacterium]